MPPDPRLRELARTAATSNNIDPDLFDRMIMVESGYNPQARSSVGAIGLGQLMPATAQELGVDPRDPEANLDGAARYLRQMLDQFNNDPVLAIAAYNAGPGAVRLYKGVPPYDETQKHIGAVFGPDYARFSSSMIFNEPEPEPRPTLEIPDISHYEAIFNEPPPSAATKPVAEPYVERTWGDTITDIVADQLDPLNLALLVASGPVAGAFKTAAAKAIGAPLVKGLAVKVAPNAFTSAGAVIGRKLIPRIAEGFGFSATFAAAELIEEPEENSSRMREFLYAFGMNEALDGVFMAAGVPFRMIGRMQREAHRTFELSRMRGASPERSAAEALLSKLGVLEAEGVPPEIMADLVRTAKEGISFDTPALLERLRSEAPRVYDSARKLGLNADQVDSGLKEMIDKIILDSHEQAIIENAARPATESGLLIERGPLTGTFGAEVRPLAEHEKESLFVERGEMASIFGAELQGEPMDLAGQMGEEARRVGHVQKGAASFDALWEKAWRSGPAPHQRAIRILSTGGPVDLNPREDLDEGFETLRKLNFAPPLKPAAPAKPATPAAPAAPAAIQTAEDLLRALNMAPPPKPPKPPKLSPHGVTMQKLAGAKKKKPKKK